MSPEVLEKTYIDFFNTQNTIPIDTGISKLISLYMGNYIYL